MPRALILNRTGGDVEASIQEVEDARLPDGDILVSILHSSINYKDALAVTGRGKIVRGDYPFVPGIDLVGRIETSGSDRFQEGDLVIGTGWGLGESHWGGYSERQRLDSRWLVPLPPNLQPEDAMVIGTAGLTAMLAVLALEAHGVEGDVLVTGASGGVGSMAVALLHGAGFSVAASTGSTDAHDYLRELGADRIIPREDLSDGPKRPMESAEWAGAVDVVGGPTLAAILSRTERHGSVAACGLAGGHELHTTVFPFILRGVNLLGIDSNTCPNDVRTTAWNRLATGLERDLLDRMKASVVGLDEISAYSEHILAGDVRGRVVVDVSR